MEVVEVKVPLVNPNEPDAMVSELRVRNGQEVHVDQILVILETTKATHELAAPAAGFIAGLSCSEGDLLQAGNLFCYISTEEGWQPAVSEKAPDINQQKPGTLRITGPAQELAVKLGIELDSLPKNTLITTQFLQSWAATPEKNSLLLDSEFDPTQIIVYGGGGHGKSVIELIRALNQYKIAGIVDDGIPAGETILGVPTLGGGDVLSELYARGIRFAANAVGGIGNINIRLKVFERIRSAGFTCPPLVHPRAFVEPSAEINAGVQVFPLAYIGSSVHIGFGVIVNTGAIISHDCKLAPYANISPGAILAGDVKVGEAALIGMGVTVNLGVEIGKNARIGNSAVVKKNAPANAIIRAGSVFPE